MTLQGSGSVLSRHPALRHPAALVVFEEQGRLQGAPRVWDPPSRETLISLGSSGRSGLGKGAGSPQGKAGQVASGSAQALQEQSIRILPAGYSFGAEEGDGPEWGAQLVGGRGGCE